MSTAQQTNQTSPKKDTKNTDAVNEKKYNEINTSFIKENATKSVDEYAKNMVKLFNKEEEELGRPMTYAEMRARFG